MSVVETLPGPLGSTPNELIRLTKKHRADDAAADDGAGTCTTAEARLRSGRISQSGGEVRVVVFARCGSVHKGPPTLPDMQTPFNRVLCMSAEVLTLGVIS